VVLAPAEKLYGIDAKTGKEMWSQKPFEPTDPALAVADGKAYFGAPRANGIFVFDVKTGKHEKTIDFNFGDRNFRAAATGSPVVAGGVLYVPMMNTWQLAAVDVTTGELLWIAPQGGFGYNRPVFVEDGVIYAGTGGGLVVFY